MARHLAVEQAIGAVIIETLNPVPHDLQADTANARSRNPPRTVVNLPPVPKVVAIAALYGCPRKSPQRPNVIPN